ncbi:MAG: nucleotidyltransferase domain-containing protein [Proteobacteria bacterium]|nr:nucleotidyltransferase domain-containing protein [Pseudomonadota bacterium]MBU2228008.1 nucleotidyltransferase domain-containing protein [Pseudomonadota bacterium]MBU2260458.1 nucleotidyltransferase domain-containing protein [Pseudomonadota bacterium]
MRCPGFQHHPEGGPDRPRRDKGHRRQSRRDGARQRTEWRAVQTILHVAELNGVTIRFPIPEAYFLHKLIIARKRPSGTKRGKDLEQCTAIMQVINDERLRQVAQAQRFGKETRRHIAASCEAIGFPLHRIGLS